MIDKSILPAFAGLAIAPYLRHAVERGADAVTFTASDLQDVAFCILELQAIVAQNAMTADDLAHTRMMAAAEREAIESQRALSAALSAINRAAASIPADVDPLEYMTPGEVERAEASIPAEGHPLDAAHVEAARRADNNIGPKRRPSPLGLD